MTAYIIKRVLAVIPILIFVGVVTFSLVHIAPGDAANIMAGDYAGPDDTQLIREELGLDKPVMQQFFEWVGRTARGDLGSSIFSGISVVELVRLKIGATLSLTLTGGVLAVLIGVPTGVLAAWKSGSLIDRIIQVWAAAGISIPGFWLGYMMIWGFSVNLRLFPVIGYVSPTEDFVQWVRHITLPSLLLGVTASAIIIRMTRASLLEVFREDYIRTARSKGLAEAAILFRHASALRGDTDPNGHRLPGRCADHRYRGDRDGIHDSGAGTAGR